MKKITKRLLMIVALAAATLASPALAQQQRPPIAEISAAVVNLVDNNHVSLSSGKVELSLPLLKFGDVAFTPYAVNGYFWESHIADDNYGRVIPCMPLPNVAGSDPSAAYMVSGECAASTASTTIQAVYGEQRASFYVSPSTGAWVPEKADGETFTDTNNGYCTWTQRDGTQIIYYAYHQSAGAPCQSENIYRVIYPDGRVADYYYYGTISNSSQNPLLSIATSDGYLLQYNYSGTPTLGSETSVTGINRAFQACSPTTSCSTAGWPTATLSWANKPISPAENMPWINNYNGSLHYVLTGVSSKREQHVLEMDSDFRIISYQPPGATQPKYNYTLCSMFPASNNVYPLQNCGYSSWSLILPNQVQQYFVDEVHTVNKEGLTWSYGTETDLNFSYPQWTRYQHSSTSPTGTSKSLVGSQSPDMIGNPLTMGPIGSFTDEDGTAYGFTNSVANQLSSVSKSSFATNYVYDAWGNITSETTVPYQGSGSISRSATYDGNCTAATLVTCTKPTSVTDPNNNTTHFTYDPIHGGVLTETDPAVNGITPQKRYTYVQRYPWYLNSGGTMTRATRPVWVLNTESHCRTSAPAAGGTGCTAANDEVVTTYDYGPDSGPNNLLVRGQTVTTAGVTRRSCVGHDKYTNKIWEQAANANASSCPAY